MKFEQYCREIAKELNLDLELVEKICKYQFKFTKDVMQDPDDYHNILYNKLFKFKLKPRFLNDKTKAYR